MDSTSQDNIIKTLIAEKILIQHNPGTYLKIVETLSQKYGKGIPDFTNPEKVIDTIKDTCGSSSETIMEKINSEFAKYEAQIPA